MLLVALALGAWQLRKRAARKRLREMDEGTRCVGCEKTETEVRDGVVHCLLCNHSEVLANVQSVQLSDKELDAATHRPLH